MRRRTMTAVRVRDSGFTLLELLVSLAIASAVMVGVQAAVGVAVDVAARASDRADTSLRVEAARAAIARWLESAHLDDALEAARFIGKDAAALNQPRDELTFVTLDPALLGGGQDGPVRIWLRVAAGDSGLVADYRALDPSLVGEYRGLNEIPVAENSPPGESVVTDNSGLGERPVAGYGRLGRRLDRRGRPAAPLVLLPEVRGLEVRYLVALGEELRWFAGWSSRVRLPRAVELRFFLDTQGDRPSELMEAPLQVALPEKG